MACSCISTFFNGCAPRGPSPTLCIVSYNQPVHTDIITNSEKMKEVEGVHYMYVKPNVYLWMEIERSDSFLRL